MSGRLMGSSVKMAESALLCGECRDVLKDPIILPCLHSVCRACLITIYGHSESRGIINCSECGEDIDKPEIGIEGFQPNYYLRGLLSVYLAKTAKDIHCKICELQKRDTFATCKCLDCGDFLCDDCGKAHNFTRMTIEHEVRPLSELTDGNKDREMRERQLIMCTVHSGEPIKYYCESCSEPICRECQLEAHVGHTCTNSSESQSSRRQAIANMINNVDQKLHDLRKVEDSVDVALTDIDKRERDLVAGVEKTAKKLTEQVEREKAEVLKELTRYMEDQRKACSQRKEQIKKVHEVMSENNVFCKNVVKDGKDEEVLYLESVIRKRMKSLQGKNLSSLAMKWNPPDVRFRNVFLSVDRIGLFDLVMTSGYSRKPQSPLKFGARHVVGLHLVKRINMTVPREDQFECRATGLACLYDDHLVVGDQENRKIKIFTRIGNFVETVANFKPNGLAICNEVIGATDQMSLNLYSNDRTIKKKISLEGTVSAYPLAALSDQYFVVANNKTITFQLYDLRGELCHEIVPTKGSKVRNPVFLTTNSKGNLIISDWMTNHLVIMDQGGKTIKDFKMKAKMGKSGWLPGSVCCDQFDNIFVSDFSRSRLVVLNPQGELMFEHLTRVDDLDRPRCMACDGNGYILVSGKGGYINVYACQYA